MAKISIETAQNVIIDHHIAGVGERIFAYIIDGAILIAYVIAINLFVSPFGSTNNTINFILYLPFGFYHLASEFFFQGQSVGKMAMKIRVVKMDGSEVGIGSYFLRWLLRPVDLTFWIAPGAVGLITILAGGKGQRVGDLAAGTTVVSLKERQDVEDTFYQTIPENYEITIPEVALLHDEDIDTIKEVMLFVQKNQSSHAISKAYKAKTLLEKKMGIKSDMRAREFFETILRDYTFYHTENNENWT